MVYKANEAKRIKGYQGNMAIKTYLRVRPNSLTAFYSHVVFLPFMALNALDAFDRLVNINLE